MGVVIDIPGWRRLELDHLVLDLNGTLARDGALLGGVTGLVMQLSQRLTVHLATADTFGGAESLLPPPVRLTRLAPGQEAEQKLALVRRLGAERSAALGNGANDALMLAAAALGVAVIGPEGAAMAALNAADVVVGDPLAGLELLLHPDRLRATLRR
ncbi:MAG: ATPase P [Thermodesulfobacteriota bacterium]